MQRYACLLLGTGLVTGMIWCSPGGVKAQRPERSFDTDPKILQIVLPDKTIEARVRSIAGMTLGYPELVLFGDARVNDLPAFTVILRRTRWDLKDLPQSVDATMKLWAEAMKLPEAERLEMMNRTENHIQLWAVETAAADPTKLKESLESTDKPHEHHREFFYLGRDEIRAWFGYMTINDFVSAEKETGLNGDAVIPALIRGVGIDDRGSNTANSCAFLLADLGAKALGEIDRAVAGGALHRAKLVTAIGRSRDRKIGDWLIALVDSKDEETRTAAKRALLHVPRSEAADLYVAWLADGAGERDVREELAACRAVKAANAKASVEQILAAPSCHWEYRSAVEFSRELAGKPGMPANLPAAEKQIRAAGFGSGDRVDQAKVDEAVAIIASADDPRSAAAIGLELALFVTKGETGAIRRAGIEILRRLPHDEGARAALVVAEHNRLEAHSDRLRKVVEELAR